MKKLSSVHLRLIIFLSFLGLAALISSFFLGDIIVQLKLLNGRLTYFVESHYALSLLLFCLIYIVDNVFALPVASLMTIGAGYFYGPLIAFCVTTVAASCGATLSFLMTRYFVGRHLQKTYAAKFKEFNKNVDVYGTHFLLAVRFIPAVPFVLVNVLAGLTNIPLKTFCWTTLLGMMPVTLLLVFSGREFRNVSSLGELVTFKIVTLLLGLALLTLFPIFLKKQRKSV